MSVARWQPGWTEVMHRAGLHHKVLAMVIWMNLVIYYFFLTKIVLVI